ncbi:hypothetical protein [Holophaga foetida]|uniref:hypothetical protein n=1 Tax=Holophaga foetida TaxID=35839 RepID=UPI0002471747|nr:hypothetical protein [Holophaga foetida]
MKHSDPQAPHSILLITHTDRDGILSGAALLRGLQEPSVDLLLTQGSYLAFELEELLEAGCRYQHIYACDTYWHPAHAERLEAAFRGLLAPEGRLLWIDHHPSSVEGEAEMTARIPGIRTLIRGDREGVHEAVSLVVERFCLDDDDVAMDMLGAARLKWTRRGLPTPEPVQAWLDVIDGLSRHVDLPAADAEQLVRTLAQGFDTPIPAALEPLAHTTRACREHTEALKQQEWVRLPSVDGGWGLLLDLRHEPLAVAYELQYALFMASDRRIDYFVVQESNSVRHYVSGSRARIQRDRLEGDGLPALRVGTHHKGLRAAASFQARKGIDLAYMTRRRPAGQWLHPWIDAHPYLVKAAWLDSSRAEAPLEEAGRAIGAAMVTALSAFRWSDASRALCPARKDRINTMSAGHPSV